MMSAALSANRFRRRLYHLVNALAHVPTNARFVLRAPAIDKFELINGLMSACPELPHHFWVTLKQIGHQMGQNDSVGKNFCPFPNCAAHIHPRFPIPSLAQALCALNGFCWFAVIHAATATAPFSVAAGVIGCLAAAVCIGAVNS